MGIRKSKVRSQKSKGFLFLSCLILLFQSCSTKNETPPPPDLIEEKEMVFVITDLTLSEAALVGEPLSGFNDTLKRINVLKEHDLTSDRFLSSFKYYTEHPLKLKSIYNEVLKVLEEKKDSTAVKN